MPPAGAVGGIAFPGASGVTRAARFAALSAPLSLVAVEMSRKRPRLDKAARM